MECPHPIFDRKFFFLPSPQEIKKGKVAKTTEKGNPRILFAELIETF